MAAEALSFGGPGVVFRWAGGGPGLGRALEWALEWALECGGLTWNSPGAAVGVTRAVRTRLTVMPGAVPPSDKAVVTSG